MPNAGVAHINQRT